jgi:hypothetical protein
VKLARETTTRARYGLAACVVALSVSAAASAQQLPERKVADIVRVDEAPVIDGSLDDSVWDNATVIRDLHQYDPAQHGIPTEESIFYVMYDDDNLYVGARLLDSDPDQIAARQMIQGQSVGIDDRFEIILDPFNNMRAGYKFMLNPNGVRRDGIYERPADINPDWDGIWDGEAVIDDQGWTAEMAIPFKTLNFDPSNPDWGFTIGRALPRKQERIAWTSYDRRVNLGSTGVLSGFENLRQGRGLDVIPSLSVAGNRDFASSIDDASTNPSLDLFYNFTPSLTGVLTFNTDFSATEVDDRQVNLSRFSAFFPEKRDFFLQDVDIFSFGDLHRNTIPFFSRRIGLSNNGQPVDLDVGAKLSGRLGRFNVGVLGVSQDGYAGRSGTVDPADMFVGRVAANIFEESSVGLIVTDGNPGSNLDNSLAGADFRYRNTRLASGRTIETATWFQESDTEGVDDEQASYGATFRVMASEGLTFESRYEVVEDNFDPALGFVNRSGYERVWLSSTYQHRPDDHPWLRSYYMWASFSQYDNNLSGDLESRWISFRPVELENNRGDNFELRLTSQIEVLVEPFEISEGIAILPGEYEFDTATMGFRFASNRVVSPRLTIEDGEYYGGTKQTLNGGIDWRPSNRLYLGAGYEYNDIELPVGNFATRLIQLRGNFAFNVRWSWVNLLQYDNISESVGLNSRLRYNPRAGEDLYIVWNHNASAVSSFSGLSSRESEFTVKYSRTFRF